MQRSGAALVLCLTATLFAANPTVDQARKLISEKKFDQAVEMLEAEHKKSPKSAEVHKALADALMSQGDSMMYNESLPPRVKYPGALKAYRKVVEIDKDNKKAQSSITQIEGIYKSMGRPVPQ